MERSLIFIGTIETPYNTIEECPRNIDLAGPHCNLHIDEKYKKGIKGLAPAQNILILYWLDGADRTLMLQNAGDDSSEPTGTFSLRSPHRPNPVGAAVVPIVDIGDGTIVVRGLDCLNGTRLLDIKPAIKLESPDKNADD